MIQPSKFNDSVTVLAQKNGFSLHKISQAVDHPIFALKKKAVIGSEHPFRLYLSSGVHGDEPAGPLALKHLLEANLIPIDLDLTIVPLINPTGFESQTRENAAGHDLNRDFRYPKNPETKAVQDFLKTQDPFDLSITLHEDWESTGFYMYSLSPSLDQTKARSILEAASIAGPIDLASEIDGSPSTAGLIDRPAEFDMEGRDDWPESFLLYSKSRHAHYTFESPSSAPIEQRIAQQVAAVLKAIELHRI